MTSIYSTKILNYTSLFGSTETSGILFIQKLSDDNFEVDRFIDPDGWYNHTEVVDGKLTLTVHTLRRFIFKK